MQFLLEYLPLIAFFAAYKLYDIYVATSVAIVASILAIVVAYIKDKKVTPMQWLTLLIVVVFGGATLFLRDERFIKWKPSVLYALFAGILLFGILIKQRDYIKTLLEQAKIELSDHGWRLLSWLWIGFFIFLAIANGLVATFFSLDTWVSFKVWGVMGLTLLFMGIVVMVMMKHSKSPPQ